MRHVIVMLMTLTSLASTTLTLANGNELYGKHTSIVAPQKTVTQSARVHVKSQRIPKFKVLRSNPYRYSKIVIDDLDYEIDDEGLITPYRRRDLNKIEHDDDISENVRWRLFLARQMALLKYREKFG